MKASCAASFLLAFFFVACEQTNETTSPSQPRVSLSISHLPSLKSGEGLYALWVSYYSFKKVDAGRSPQHDSGLVRLGEFNVASDGRTIIDSTGAPVRLGLQGGNSPQLLNDAVLSIQAGGTLHSEREPGSILIGGKFRGDQSTAVADLDTRYGDAFGSDFSESQGRYTLVAPTSVPADSNSGIWFVVMQPTLAAGLRVLPELHHGWIYEGWVEVPREVGLSDRLVSTGKFLHPDSSDVDGAGAGKGPNQAFAFPGQDFITGRDGLPARPDLRNKAVFITIEPDPDNSPAPSPFRILGTRPVEAVWGSNPVQNLLPGELLNVASVSLPRALLTITR